MSLHDPAAVLAVDPGRAKCGIALVRDSTPRHIERSIVPTESLVVSVTRLVRLNADIRTILVGSGTGSGTLARALRAALPDHSLKLVDERGTTLLARDRYFLENPSSGWKRLIPTSLMVPPVPIDDYAALLLAERYLDALTP